MSAPERIWADIDDEYTRGAMIGRVFATDIGDVEYTRTDLSAAAEARARIEGWNAAVEAAASKAENHLDDWANDLAATRDDLITAQTSGVWNGRKVSNLSWLKKEASRFGERAEAVAESASHTASAIRALRKGTDHD